MSVEREYKFPWTTIKPGFRLSCSSSCSGARYLQTKPGCLHIHLKLVWRMILFCVDKEDKEFVCVCLKKKKNWSATKPQFLSVTDWFLTWLGSHTELYVVCFIIPFPDHVYVTSVINNWLQVRVATIQTQAFHLTLNSVLVWEEYHMSQLIISLLWCF